MYDLAPGSTAVRLLRALRTSVSTTDQHSRDITLENPRRDMQPRGQRPALMKTAFLTCQNISE